MISTDDSRPATPLWNSFLNFSFKKKSKSHNSMLFVKRIEPPYGGHPLYRAPLYKKNFSQDDQTLITKSLFSRYFIADTSL